MIINSLSTDKKKIINNFDFINNYDHLYFETDKSIDESYKSNKKTKTKLSKEENEDNIKVSLFFNKSS